MRLQDAWDRYWFRDASLFDLAMVRVILVGFQLCWLAMVIPGYLDLASKQPDFIYRPLIILQLFTAFIGGDRPSVELNNAIYWAAIVSGFFALVGFKARVALILFAASNVFLQAYIYSFHDLHHQEGLMMIMLAALALSPSARVLSVDGWLVSRRDTAATHMSGLHGMLKAGDPFARWPILLGHWLFALFYLSAVYSKLTIGGFDWANGFTLQYHLVLDGIKFDRPLGVWLGQFHNLVVIVQSLVFIFQATFFLILLRPALKWIYVPLGFSFHVGIYATMGADFQMWMAGYCVFIPWAAAVNRLLSSRGGGRQVAIAAGRAP